MACMMLIGNTKKSFPKIQSNKKFPLPIYNPFKNMYEKINEDYVSFDIAKLLKQKGFHWSVCKNSPNFSYNRDGEFSGPSWDSKYFAPTQQMVIKWLRTVHNLCVFVIPSYVAEHFHNGWALYPECDGKWEWCASKNDGSMATFGYDIKGHYCNSPEEATNELILYALENLV